MQNLDCEYRNLTEWSVAHGCETRSCVHPSVGTSFALANWQNCQSARGNWSEPLGNCPTWPETWTDREIAMVQDRLLVYTGAASGVDAWSANRK